MTLFLLIMFQFPSTFLQNQTRMLIFIVQFMTILGRIMIDGRRDHLRDAPWEDIFKLGASAAAAEFCV